MKVGKKMTACLLATAMLACEAPIDVSAGNLANYYTKEKYWCSTNGSKIESENSNFTITPDCDLKGYSFWITTTATVKVKGGAKKSSISCEC